MVLILSLISSCKKRELLISNNKKRTIVVLGSSTAAGVGASKDSSWVMRLKNNLSSCDIHNLAVCGYTTYQVMPTNYPQSLGRPKVDELHNATYALIFKPDLVIISMTNNDIAYGYQVKGEYISNLLLLKEYFQNNGVKDVFITTTFPRDNVSFDSLYLARTLINERFGVKSINIFDTLSDSKNKRLYKEFQYGDGIHVNNRGHKVIFYKVKEKLKMIFN